jgi:hypothetical protein
MAITQVNVSSPAVEIIFTDTAIGAAVDAVKASSAVVYSITVNNSANAAASYLKVWNVASGSVTVGTTAPDIVIFIPASTTIVQNYFTLAVPGLTLGTAVSMACVTTGGTAGTTPPVSSVSCSVTYV